jgi:hypothetical protein
MEAQKDPLAVELGRRGGLARARRLKPEQRSEIARRGQRAAAPSIARTKLRQALDAAEQALYESGVMPWRELRGPKDPEAYIALNWARRIPKEWEQLLDAAKLAQNWDLATRILMAMTAMSPLTPARLRQVADDGLLRLPGDIDLSHIDDETLERIAGKKPSNLE